MAGGEKNSNIQCAAHTNQHRVTSMVWNGINARNTTFIVMFRIRKTIFLSEPPNFSQRRNRENVRLNE
jgi:hypothetical protein